MKIAVLTPCYSGMVNIQFMMSLMNTITRVKKSECSFFTVVGCSILPQARNMLLAKGLAMGADKLVLIDDDISWHSDDFQKLVLGPEPIFAGTYQKRPHNHFDRPEMAISLFPSGLEADNRGLCEVDGAGTGFMKIDREVVEAMKSHCVKLGDKTADPEQEKHLYEYFQFARMQKDDGKVYLEGEDYNFCRKARSLGFKTWVDPSIKLGHHVGQFKFGANLEAQPLL